MSPVHRIINLCCSLSSCVVFAAAQQPTSNLKFGVINVRVIHLTTERWHTCLLVLPGTGQEKSG